jgi:hypothetical protein
MVIATRHEQKWCFMAMTTDSGPLAKKEIVMMGKITASQLRETGELAIEFPPLRRPTFTEIRKKYPWVISIERDTTNEGPVTLSLATVLQLEERASSISGVEYENRLASTLDVSLGYQHLRWLLNHQYKYPDFKALLGKVYIDFPGIVVLDADGSRRIPYCSRTDVPWRARWHWLGVGFHSGGRVAVVRHY